MEPRAEPRANDHRAEYMIKNYAAQKGYVYVDYYSALKDEHGGRSARLSKDGVHPLPTGFAIMAPLAEAGIEKALAR